MTTVAQLLAASAAVKAVVGTNPIRIYRWGRAPADAVAPYILWTVVADVPAASLDGPGMDNLRVQVDCYAPTGPVCDQLAIAARDAIELDGENVMIALNSAAQDDTTNLFRDSRDYSLWVDH
jgi:hypothetical protein